MGADGLKRAPEEIPARESEATAEKAGVTDPGLDLDALRARPREELQEMARTLGLTRVSRLRKDELARRVHEALLASRDRRVPAAPGAATPETAKLDLGAPAQAEEPPQDIPWSYGLDRITAAAVDPDRLFVYWEVTEPAVERARAALGPGGSGAWLDLRVYDTTGRIFDGTNANSYFDHRVERWDRQWFFAIGKPTSTAVVEIGMRSSEGYFVKIARSGRVDFPRREPAPWREPEWMTVFASGEVVHAGGGVPRRGPPGAPSGVEGAGLPPPPPFPTWLIREPPHGEVLVRHLFEGGWERVEWQAFSGEGWAEIARRTEWSGPTVVTSWEAGPFMHPVRIEPPSREAWEGGAHVYRVGDVTHVLSGPWQVVIRNLGAHTERTVAGRWEVYRWRLAQVGEVRGAPWVGPALAPGASELLAGATERHWIAGSEQRLGGASELWRLGASEVLLRGASERVYVGASEWRMRGASEVRFVGASEVRLVGASERRLVGASEVRLVGASEVRLVGASERWFVGASEVRLAGASEWRLGGASEQLGGSEPRLADASSEPRAYPPAEDILPAPTE